MTNVDKCQSWELLWFDDMQYGVEAIDTCIENFPMITYRETEFRRQLNQEICDMLLSNCVHSITSIDRRLSIQYRHSWWTRFPKGTPE